MQVYVREKIYISMCLHESVCETERLKKLIGYSKFTENLTK